MPLFSGTLYAHFGSLCATPPPTNLAVLTACKSRLILGHSLVQILKWAMVINCGCQIEVEQDYAAIGVYNQYIYVNPKERTVSVKLSAYSNYWRTNDDKS